jgi:sulfite exporter TauE/SafE
MSFWLIQLIGAIGYAILSISYYKKNRKQILFLQIIANIFFTIHYYLLGGIIGAISNIIGLTSYTAIFVCDKFNKKILKNVLSLIMIIILLIFTIIRYEEFYSVLPFISFTFTTISFLDGDVKVIRLFGCIAAICWLIYAIVYDSYVAIAFEGITLIATVYSIFHSKRQMQKSVSS